MSFQITKNEVREDNSGVFCDIDGTLISWKPKRVDGKFQIIPHLNEEVVELLHRLESEGKSITLWTGGDADATQEKIAHFDLPWPIVSKDNYRGRTVEIAIDDEGLDAYNIQVKKLYLYAKGE